MATSPTESVAHPRDARHHPPGPPNYKRLAEVLDRLPLALDRAKEFGAFVDPRFLIELRDFVGEVLQLIGDRAHCRYGCGRVVYHCPVNEPLEARVAHLQRAGWVLSWDRIEARVAHDTAACAARA